VTLPPLHWWRTVFVLIPLIALYTILLGTISLASGLVDRRGAWPHRCAQAWSWLILRTSGVRIDRRGAPPPADASCIYVANHSSIYDIPILFTAVPRQLRIMAKAALGHVPFIGWHLHRSGHLLVNRQNPGAGIFKRMQRMVGQGASLIVFPEGSRTRDGRVARFKGGVFLLAIEAGLPVVPVSVVGSRVVMPQGRLRVSPATVQVTIHEPIPTAGMSRDDARPLAERVRAIIAQVVEGEDGLMGPRQAGEAARAAAPSRESAS
jgi:1-acyl-sn-glycerol-3-phosphate acyltransferase